MAREMWSIISNNCWGGALYQELGLEYNTPTVGLWIYPDDYLALLSDFRYAINCPLRFTDYSRHGPKPYPVGVIGGGVEVQFMHYKSREEALRKWTSRVARLPARDDEIFVKICDRDGFERRHLDAFARIPFANKVAFLKRGRFDAGAMPWVVEVDWADETVGHGMDLWRHVRREGVFDAAAWVGATRQPAASPAAGTDWLAMLKMSANVAATAMAPAAIEAGP